MFQRPMLFLGILAAAVVVPYVLLSKNVSTTAGSQWNRLLGKSDGQQAGFSWPFQSGAAEPLAELPGNPAPVPLEQVFRFDVSPRMVTQTWPRVSTVLGETDRMGLRVALVTGTQADDVAGSLTYYFDDRHQVQRITLQGLTGDENRLVALLASQHGLRPSPTLGAGLYTNGYGDTASQLQVSHLPVVRATTPNHRVEVAVDLHRPGAQPAEQTAASTTPRQPIRRLLTW